MNNWWKNAVVYQIYPKSFNDSNGDGVGDIPGIIEKIPYLAELGINVIWLSPVYSSPMKDNGYDISDYYQIDPSFGTMDDMSKLISIASQHEIKIIMDLVVNHTSDQHAWFKEAIKNPSSKYRDYYVWKDNEGHLPNGLMSCFGGPAWTLNEESDQYYLHLFAPEQPDLNWENASMRQEVYDMMNWWLNRGVAGFRMDVIDLIGKVPDQEITGNGPKLHDYLKEMNTATTSNFDVLTVGECWGANIDNAQDFSNPNGSELSMVFQFEHVTMRFTDGNKWQSKPFDLPKFKDIMEKWQHGLYNKGWNSLFLNNHDLPRMVSFWGNDQAYRVESAKMLASMMHGMQGTPYIYQGEEIGMTNVRFDSIDDYNDVELLNFYHEAKEKGTPEAEIMESIYAIGRDNARTPVQWNHEEHAGFTTGTPWLKVNPNKDTINVQAALEDKNSIFYHYQSLIALRKKYQVLTDGDFNFIQKDHPHVYAYVRQNNDSQLFSISNFSDKNVPFDYQLPQGQLLLSNYEDFSGSSITSLRPFESILFFVQK